MHVPTDNLVLFSCILCGPGLSFAVASQAHLERMIARAKYSQSERRTGPKFRYRVETAASILGVSPRSLRYGIHVGLIPVVRDGTGIFILADVLDTVSTMHALHALQQRRQDERDDRAPTRTDSGDERRAADPDSLL